MRNPGTFKQTTRSYLAESSVHGTKYIVWSDNYLVTKWIWSVICFLALFGAVFLCYLVAHDHRNKPTVTVIDSTAYNIKNLPFVAVTVCVSKLRDEKRLHDIVKGILGSDDHKDFEDLKELLGKLRFVLYGEYSNFEDLVSRLKNNPVVRNLNLTDIMLQLHEENGKVFVDCRYEYDLGACEKFFAFQRTDAGFCYSFNSRTSQLMVRDRSPGVITLEENDLEVFEMYAGVFRGFWTNYTFESLIEGQVFAHAAWDYPDLQQGRKIKEGLLVSLTVQHTFSTSAIRSVAVNRRQCLFPDEMKLNVYKNYSYQNCIFQCRMDHLYKFCNCLPYFYNQKDGRRVCGIEDLLCIMKYEYHLVRVIITDDSAESQIEKDEAHGIYCFCLPTCDEYLYEIASDYIVPSPRVGIYFPPEHIVAYKRDVPFIEFDLLVDLGSAAGLFLGCSVLSILELIYFFTLRLWFESKRRRKVRQDSEDPPDSVNIEVWRTVHNRRRQLSERYRERLMPLYGRLTYTPAITKPTPFLKGTYYYDGSGK